MVITLSSEVSDQIASIAKKKKSHWSYICFIIFILKKSEIKQKNEQFPILDFDSLYHANSYPMALWVTVL